jgi:hypothetical protein
VSSQNQPHDVVGASREANKEGSGGAGGGVAQSAKGKGKKIKPYAAPFSVLLL